ncbi:MAG: hypothetical protein AAGC74_02855 [Verrucomicrobiota bacterium]
MKALWFFLISIGLCFGVQAEEQTICPIMVDSEIDEEEVVEFEGKTILMCCGSCIKNWNQNPLYYLKIGRELKLLPQFAEVTKELEEQLAEVELMEQRFCAIRNDNVVGPHSPFIEYEGKKIYFYKEGDIKRRWDRNPEAAFEKARKAGVLPQFDGKKS